ncbi:WcaF family extracellular polysaccharide biosynthesis acetyltransferase [Providencia rettgeri]
MKINLSLYSNEQYYPGKTFKIILWMIISYFIFETKIPYPSKIKRSILKIFGASVGTGVVIKPNVKIKYPWYLNIGSYSWIGEHVWIDNLVTVNIGSSCCISQGAMLLTGNHDFKTQTFDLITGEIKLEDGVWVGAKSIICPNTILEKNCVLCVASVAIGFLHSDSIYQGNPATIKRKRF